MVDYSKWDKLECSSSDEDEYSKRRRPSGPPKDDVPCPPSLGPQIAKVWNTLSREKKLQIIEAYESGEFTNDGGPAYHPDKSLHKPLFDPKEWKRWVDPKLFAVIERWNNDKDAGFSNINLDSFAEMKVEAPGIISFPAFTDEFCEILLAEVKHYHQSGMRARPPNSMNNYGLVLNEIGMRPAFNKILSEVLLPIGARLFGDDRDRVKSIRGDEVGTENWGGSTLDDHHSFIVQYRPSDDKHLDMHIDECDVTFNFGITPTDNYEGNDLTFCGMFDADNHRKYHHTYKHVKGRCVVHSGKRRHGALDITKGERASLIMWTKSNLFRQSMQYILRNRGGLNHGDADRVCLSYTHDPDYKKLTPKKMHYKMLPKQDNDGDGLSSTTGSAHAVVKKWMRICADSDLQEGAAKKLELDTENEQVAVFRHNGELFAIDNRCAHMGGPLCEGDIEDLGTHMARSGGSIKLTSGARREDGVVKCPRHGMCFNIRTGDNIKGGHMKQKKYPVRLSEDGKDIEVEVEVEDVGTQVSDDADMSE